MKRILEEIERVTGFSYLDLIVKDKTYVKSEARFMNAKCLRDAGYTYAEIGRAMNRDHSTIIYSLTQHANLYSTNKEYADKFDLIDLRDESKVDYYESGQWHRDRVDEQLREFAFNEQYDL